MEVAGRVLALYAILVGQRMRAHVLGLHLGIGASIQWLLVVLAEFHRFSPWWMQQPLIRRTGFLWHPGKATIINTWCQKKCFQQMKCANAYQREMVSIRFAQPDFTFAFTVCVFYATLIKNLYFPEYIYLLTIVFFSKTWAFCTLTELKCVEMSC